MEERNPVAMVVSPGPRLRWTMEELRNRYGYRLLYTDNPYEAGLLLEHTSVDAVVCEAAPAYTAECRLLREIWQRSARLPVFLFVEPESEEDLLDELRYGSFHVVRAAMSLEEFHRELQQAIARAHGVRAA